MGHTKGQGLAGKARHVRTRNRATRLYANRMIEEYLDPADNCPSHRRPALIRGRGDFLPAVAHADLSAETSRRSTATANRSASLARGDEPRNGLCGSVSSGGPEGLTHLSREGAIRFGGGSRTLSDATRAREAIFGRRPSFTWGGFLAGCALGSMAASLLLAVMHVALR